MSVLRFSFAGVSAEVLASVEAEIAMLLRVSDRKIFSSALAYEKTFVRSRAKNSMLYSANAGNSVSLDSKEDRSPWPRSRPLFCLVVGLLIS